MFHPWNALRQHFDVVTAPLRARALARVENLRGSSLFFLVYSIIEGQQSAGRLPLLLVTETNGRAERMRQFLAGVERLVADREPGPGEYLSFPDFEPQNLFEYYDAPLDLIEQRNAVLDALRLSGQPGGPKAIVASYKALLRLLPSPEDYYSQELRLRPGGEISREELTSRLSDLGYHPVTTVVSVGEFAMRGGIVDVFPAGYESPLRIDLFGSEVEQLLSFDPGTQRSTGPLDSAQIQAVSAQASRLRDPGTLGWLRERWEQYTEAYRDALVRAQLDRLGEVVESDIELLAQGGRGPRAGWYWQAVQSSDACLLSYMPAGSPLIIHEEGFVESETSSYFRFWQSRFEDWKRNGLSFLGLEDFYLVPAAGLAATAGDLALGNYTYASAQGEESVKLPPFDVLLTHSFEAPRRPGEELPVADAGLETPPGGQWGTVKLAGTAASIRKSDTGHARIDRPLSVLTQFSQRIRELLVDAGVKAEVESAILPGGFVLPGSPDWTVITDVEVFGEIAEVGEAPVRRYRNDAVRRPDELAPGDYVVHIDYGIGRFSQLADRLQGGAMRSFVEIEYADRDRLFVPVEQLDRLRRYSFDGSTPQLNHLGRDTWKKTKDKVRADTIELAKKLLALYKTRQVRSGEAFSQHTVWEDEFAEGFPYEMTGDQLNAWREVEADMESPKPMDRLLVGDVGFGKTEIAMRAAFKAAIDGRQSLVLCPTTVLADQHFTTFTQRFRPFPFKVAILSRFQSPAENKATVAAVKAGQVDVVIATHRGLSKDVEFPRLGLLVVDEEQRFGVKQKEALKMRFPLVDVLAMSATPIPRTLHMSLIGLRDISVIETPPGGRKSVKTYVGEFDELMVREAILRELGRGGQIYFLHNRVADIEKIKEWLERLIPLDIGATEVSAPGSPRVLVAHGQMADERLEEIMHAFSLGAYKVLLATTIIENGLDIPSVNTIIVDHAEFLGLSQMHQLRGRVGRSRAQAYAYFFHETQRVLTEEAQNRLHAIYNYAYLGAGYEIAQSDLRIRGAGNLLGEDQSGLARQVGFEYYCELLARSIRDVKELSDLELDAWDGQPRVEDRPGAQVDVPLAAYIPESYVEDPVLRLELLRELAQAVSTEEADAFELELLDRFGEPPAEVANLIRIMRIKLAATALGIERLSYNRVKKTFELKFYADEGNWIRRATLADGRMSLNPQGGLLLDYEFAEASGAADLLETLDRLGPLRQAVQ